MSSESAPVFVQDKIVVRMWMR